MQQRQKLQQSITSNGSAEGGGGDVGNGAGDDMDLGSDFDPDEDLVKMDSDGDEVDEDAERKRALQNILESKCGLQDEDMASFFVK